MKKKALLTYHCRVCLFSPVRLKERITGTFKIFILHLGQVHSLSREFQRKINSKLALKHCVQMPSRSKASTFQTMAQLLVYILTSVLPSSLFCKTHLTNPSSVSRGENSIQAILEVIL